MRRRIVIERAERLHQVPSFPAPDRTRYLRRLRSRGVPPIDLTTGGLQTTDQEAVLTDLSHRLQNRSARPVPVLSEFCEAFSLWFARRFEVELDPETQILPIIGSKVGVSCLPMALVNPGETVLIPDPAYPAYRTGAIMAGGNIQTMPLLERNDYLPNLRQIEADVAQKSKLMFISYPNNPTGAVADLAFYRDLVDFARKHNIVICHDATHHFLTYEGYEAPSFLQAPGGGDVGVEIFSMSMFLGGASYDLGVAVGNPAVLSALAQLTNHLYTPFFPLMQEILIEPLRQNDALTHECVPHYMRRRDILVEGLQRSGWKLRKPKAGLYVWIPVPPRYSSLRFSVLLRKAGIFTVPGSYMGEYGEGYIRCALNATEEEMNEVVRRIDRGVFRSLLRKLPLFHSSLV